MTAAFTLDEMPAEKPIIPKTMNMEIDKEPELQCEVEIEAQVEGKKTKKKEKKEQAKRKKMKSWIHPCRFWGLGSLGPLHEQQLVCSSVCVCVHVLCFHAYNM